MNRRGKKDETLHNRVQEELEEALHKSDGKTAKEDQQGGRAGDIVERQKNKRSEINQFVEGKELILEGVGVITLKEVFQDESGVMYVAYDWKPLPEEQRKSDLTSRERTLLTHQEGEQSMSVKNFGNMLEKLGLSSRGMEIVDGIQKMKTENNQAQSDSEKEENDELMQLRKRLAEKKAAVERNKDVGAPSVPEGVGVMKEIADLEERISQLENAGSQSQSSAQEDLERMTTEGRAQRERMRMIREAGIAEDDPKIVALKEEEEELKKRREEMEKRGDGQTVEELSVALDVAREAWVMSGDGEKRTEYEDAFSQYISAIIERELGGEVSKEDAEHILRAAYVAEKLKVNQLQTDRRFKEFQENHPALHSIKETAKKTIGWWRRLGWKQKIAAGVTASATAGAFGVIGMRLLGFAAATSGFKEWFDKNTKNRLAEEGSSEARVAAESLENVADGQEQAVLSQIENRMRTLEDEIKDWDHQRKKNTFYASLAGAGTIAVSSCIGQAAMAGLSNYFGWGGVPESGGGITDKPGVVDFGKPPSGSDGPPVVEWEPHMETRIPDSAPVVEADPSPAPEVAPAPAHVNITDRVWMDNNTSKFDLNELRLQWGGGGDGIHDSFKDTVYAFNVGEMTSGGSFHGGMSIDAQNAIASGELKMYMTGAGGNTIEVPMDKDGNVLIKPGSEAYELFSLKDGQAVFTGKWAEVGILKDDGTLQVLATHEGGGTASVDAGPAAVESASPPEMPTSEAAVSEPSAPAPEATPGSLLHMSESYTVSKADDGGLVRLGLDALESNGVSLGSNESEVALVLYEHLKDLPAETIREAGVESGDINVIRPGETIDLSKLYPEGRLQEILTDKGINIPNVLDEGSVDTNGSSRAVDAPVGTGAGQSDDLPWPPDRTVDDIDYDRSPGQQPTPTQTFAYEGHGGDQAIGLGNSEPQGSSLEGDAQTSFEGEFSQDVRDFVLGESALGNVYGEGEEQVWEAIRDVLHQHGDQFRFSRDTEIVRDGVEMMFQKVMNNSQLDVWNDIPLQMRDFTENYIAKATLQPSNTGFPMLAFPGGMNIREAVEAYLSNMSGSDAVAPIEGSHTETLDDVTIPEGDGGEDLSVSSEDAARSSAGESTAQIGQVAPPGSEAANDSISSKTKDPIGPAGIIAAGGAAAGATYAGVRNLNEYRKNRGGEQSGVTTDNAEDILITDVTENYEGYFNTMISSEQQKNIESVVDRIYGVLQRADSASREMSVEDFLASPDFGAKRMSEVEERGYLDPMESRLESLMSRAERRLGQKLSDMETQEIIKSREEETIADYVRRLTIQMAMLDDIRFSPEANDQQLAA